VIGDLSVHYYNTICGAKLKRDTKKGVVTASYEGMLAAIWDNNHNNWITLFNWSQQPENKGKIQPNEGGKFTSTKKGQRVFGGLEPEGLEAYNTYYEKNLTACKLKKRKEVEKAMYDQLCSTMGIITTEHKSHIKGICEKKRKKLPKDHPYLVKQKRIVRMKILDDKEEVVLDGE
jgi:hypothetical protein